MKRNEAKHLRLAIEHAAQSLSEDVALTVVVLYPMWVTGVDYIVGFKVQHSGKLWRCIQAHTSLEGWQPQNAASLWEEICETHSGAIDDPITYSGNMILEKGKYYIQDDVIYLCNRNTDTAVFAPLASLVNIYVESI